MRKGSRIGVSGLVAVMMLVGAGALPASAAPVYFGAKLNAHSQPSNAEGGQRCSDDIPGAESCSWVSTEAYHNGGHERAPKTGTIGTLKLVSCISGSFILQIAQANTTTHRARVLRNGPTINYLRDPQPVCGGDNGDAYVVQSFPVNVHVTIGDYIGIYASKVGTLYCSGGNGTDLYNPPLGASSAYRTRRSSASCNLMIQLVYKS